MYIPPRLLSMMIGATISSGFPGRSDVRWTSACIRQLDSRMVLLKAALVGASGMSYVYEPEVVPVISDGKIPGQMVLTRIFILAIRPKAEC